MSLYGGSPLGIIPYGHWEALDQSIRPKVNDLLLHPEKRRYLVVQIEPYDPGVAATVTRNFGAGLSRIPGSTKLWNPRLLEAFNVSTQLSEALELLGGAGTPVYGTMQVGIGDQPDAKQAVDFEALTTYVYGGYPFRVWLGGDPEDGWTWADYLEVFRGIAEQATWNERRLNIVVRDPSVRLDVPLQTTLYAGTGADEGGVDLEGKTKPIGLGRPRLVPAVLVDRENLIYQVHDGAILGAHSLADGDDVMDRGDRYISDGNLPSVANLRAWTQVSGHYITDNALGLLRLGSSPVGQPLVSFRGALDSGTFREKQGELLRFVLKTRAGFTDDDIDLASMASLDAAGRELSLWMENPTTVRQVVADLLVPRGYSTFDSIGRFVAGRIQIGTAVATLRNDSSGAGPSILSMERIDTPHPAYRVSLGYARNWFPLFESDLAPSDTTEIDRDFAINEYRRVTANNDSIWNPVTKTGPHPRAQDLTFDTLWQNKEDAQSEVNELMALLGASRDLYQVTCQRIAFRFRVGQTVRIVYDRYKLTAGRLFVILGVVEASRSGRTVLRVWG